MSVLGLYIQYVCCLGRLSEFLNIAFPTLGPASQGCASLALRWPASSIKQFVFCDIDLRQMITQNLICYIDPQTSIQKVRPIRSFSNGVERLGSHTRFLWCHRLDFEPSHYIIPKIMINMFCVTSTFLDIMYKTKICTKWTPGNRFVTRTQKSIPFPHLVFQLHHKCGRFRNAQSAR